MSEAKQDNLWHASVAYSIRDRETGDFVASISRSCNHATFELDPEPAKALMTTRIQDASNDCYYLNFRCKGAKFEVVTLHIQVQVQPIIRKGKSK